MIKKQDKQYFPEAIAQGSAKSPPKYLGKINWIFANCPRLYLWVAVRCERTLQWESKLYTNNFARLLITIIIAIIVYSISWTHEVHLCIQPLSCLVLSESNQPLAV